MAYSLPPKSGNSTAPRLDGSGAGLSLGSCSFARGCARLASGVAAFAGSGLDAVRLAFGALLAAGAPGGGAAACWLGSAGPVVAGTARVG